MGMNDVLGAIRDASRRLWSLVPNADSEAEMIVEHVLGRDRAHLYANPSALITHDQWAQIDEVVERRRTMEPLQYLLGSQAFRRIEVLVGPGVLVPRQETEIVVEHALSKIASIESPKVIELGTGSGAIAASIIDEMPSARVWATEKSPEALIWAHRNLDPLANITLLQGDLFEPLDASIRGTVDLVVSNPPYLSESEIEESPADVRDYEPRVATVAGPTGIEVSARIVRESPGWLRPGGWLVMETSEARWPELAELLKRDFVDVQCLPDLAGLLRVAMAPWGRDSQNLPVAQQC